MTFELGSNEYANELLTGIIRTQAQLRSLLFAIAYATHDDDEAVAEFVRTFSKVEEQFYQDDMRRIFGEHGKTPESMQDLLKNLRRPPGTL